MREESKITAALFAMEEGYKAPRALLGGCLTPDVRFQHVWPIRSR